MDDIVLFSECSIDDVKVIGKKAAFLCELHSKGFNIPPGFIITGNLFVKFIEMVGLKENIAEILMSNMDKERKSMQIQQTILNIPFPEDMANFIYQNYIKLGNNNEPFVALKVSSTSDYIEDSFLLNIQGKERLINGIKSCWSSVFSSENIDLKRFKPSIIIQNMVNPIKSGYVYSRNPLNGSPNEVFIQVCSGLGNAITLSQVIPSAYVVKKDDLTVTNSFMKEQKIQYSLNMERRRTEKIELSEPVKNILDDYIIKELAKIAIRSETRINDPQRISFGIDKTISVLSSKSINTQFFNNKFGNSYITQSINPERQNQENNGEYRTQNPQNFEEDNYKNDGNSGAMMDINEFVGGEDGVRNNIQDKNEEVYAENRLIQENRTEEPHEYKQNLETKNPGANLEQNQSRGRPDFDDETMFNYYQPDVHHNNTSNNQQNNGGNNSNIVNSNDSFISQNNSPKNELEVQTSFQNEQKYQQEKPEVKSQFENKFSPENPQNLMGKAYLIGGFTVVGCDMAILAALKKKYRELFYKEPPMYHDVLINEMKNRINLPYEEEIKRIRKIRDNFLNSGKEPEPREIHYSLDYSNKFVDEF